MTDKLVILFPCNPLDRKSVDVDFHEEANACTLLGIKWFLFDHEEFVKSETISGNLPINGDKNTILLRSWMLKGRQYNILVNELEERNFSIINSHSCYINCHHFPNVYEYIKQYSSKAIWFRSLIDDERAIKLWQSLDSDVILKDYVKSEKDNPDLFILSKNLSNDDFWNKILKFIDARGKLFNEGIVLKELVTLKKYNNKTNEWRIFILDKKIVSCKNNSNLSESVRPDIKFLNEIIEKIESNFFTIDIAEKEDGSWMILETGDGQVSGLATEENTLEFYSKLKEILCQQMA